MFTGMFRRSFTLEGFSLQHLTQEDFTICCWQKGKHPTAVWVTYRIVLGLYFAATFFYVFCYFILNPKEDSDKYKFFIFLTNWTYTLETFLFCLAGVLTLLAYRQRKEEVTKEEESELPWYFKMYWFSYSSALTVSVLVTSMFWIKIYDPVLFPVTDRGLIIHAFNCIFMVIDFILIAHPIRFLHFYCPVAYSLIYLVFSMIYEFSGGTGVNGVIPIYKVLDWNEGPVEATLTSLMALGVIFTVHFTFALLSKVKMILRGKYID